MPTLALFEYIACTRALLCSFIPQAESQGAHGGWQGSGYPGHHTSNAGGWGSMMPQGGPQHHYQQVRACVALHAYVRTCGEFFYCVESLLGCTKSFPSALKTQKERALCWSAEYVCRYAEFSVGT